MDLERIDRSDPALPRRWRDGTTPVQGEGAWRQLLPAIAADVREQPLLTPGELRRIEVPALVVVGDRDPFVPVDHAWGLTRQLPDGRLLVVPDAGHEVPVRRPGLFNEAATAFYRSTEKTAEARAGRADVEPDGGVLAMTTLLALYRRPEGGDEALATFERRYRDEHLPLVARDARPSLDARAARRRGARLRRPIS